MKQTLIRFFLFILCLLGFHLLVGLSKSDSVLYAFALAWILETAFTELVNR